MSERQNSSIEIDDNPTQPLLMNGRDLAFLPRLKRVQIELNAMTMLTEDDGALAELMNVTLDRIRF